MTLFCFLIFKRLKIATFHVLVCLCQGFQMEEYAHYTLEHTFIIFFFFSGTWELLDFIVRIDDSCKQNCISTNKTLQKNFLYFPFKKNRIMSLSGLLTRHIWEKEDSSNFLSICYKWFDHEHNYHSTFKLAIKLPGINSICLKKN